MAPLPRRFLCFVLGRCAPGPGTAVWRPRVSHRGHPGLELCPKPPSEAGCRGGNRPPGLPSLPLPLLPPPVAMLRKTLSWDPPCCPCGALGGCRASGATGGGSGCSPQHKHAAQGLGGPCFAYFFLKACLFKVV